MREAALRAQSVYSIRQLVEKVCEKLEPKDYRSEALANYYYVLSHTRYMRDPRTVELVRDPWEVVAQMQAGQIPQIDCDDMAALLASMHLMCGFRVRLITVAFRDAFYQGERQYSHIFCQAQDKGGTWLTTDPVANVKTAEMLNRAVAAKVWPVA